MWRVTRRRAMIIQGHNCIGHNYIGTRYAPLESSHQGGHFEYRYTYTRAIDMPSAMPKRVRMPHGKSDEACDKDVHVMGHACV